MNDDTKIRLLYRAVGNLNRRELAIWEMLADRFGRETAYDLSMEFENRWREINAIQTGNSDIMPDNSGESGEDLIEGLYSPSNKGLLD